MDIKLADSELHKRYTGVNNELILENFEILKDSGKSSKEDYMRKIYKYSFAVANFSFMGNAVVLGIFGEGVLFDYMIFTLPRCLYVYSFGTASLIPKTKEKI